MVREILFRGFRKNANGTETIYLNGEEIKGKWVYGSLVYKKCFRDNGMVEVYYKEWEEEYAYIYENSIDNNIEEYPTKFIEVIPDTISQYTGLDDKNGKKIFENDRVHIIYDGREHIYQVIFDKQELDFKATNGKENYEDNFQYLGCCDEVEIIGTIFDGKEVK